MEWISVKDQLPPDRITVLLFYVLNSGRELITTGYHRSNISDAIEPLWIPDNRVASSSPMYWMYLPETPNY